MSDEAIIPGKNNDNRLMIFTSPEDQTVMDISKMSNFISNGISQLANNIIATSDGKRTIVPIAEISIVDPGNRFQREDSSRHPDHSPE